MKIAILTLGTRGDVQPFIAFGQGLQRAGHTVRIVASAHYEPLVREHGLDFGCMRDTVQPLLNVQTLNKRVSESNQGELKSVRALAQEMSETLGRMREDTWKACQDAEVIIDSTNGWGYHIAEKLNVRLIRSHCAPYSTTRVFPAIMAPRLPLGSGYNLLTHKIFNQIAWRTTRQAINEWRQQCLDLPPITSSNPNTLMDLQRVPYIYAYSPILIPTPADWPDHFVATGFWLLDPPTEWQPPAKLVDFLQAGPPPVYIGFGSMTTNNPEQATEVAVGALRRARQRGILLTGWGALAQTTIGDDIMVIDDVPHTWLFPQVAAAVFHSTPGTGAAIFRAGIPSVPVPFFADQPFWAQRITALGIGTAPIPQRWLSEPRLAAAISQATSDQDMRARAARYGQLFRAEDGVANAVAAFHAHV